jgi:hypothetical protein
MASKCRCELFAQRAFAADPSLPVERRASPPGWTLRLRSGQARETLVPPLCIYAVSSVVIV